MQKQLILCVLIIISIISLISVEVPTSAHPDKTNTQNDIYIEIVDTFQPTQSVEKLALSRFNILLPTENSDSLLIDNTESIEIEENFVEKNKPNSHDKVEQTANTQTNNKNYVGRFKIPDCNIDVAIYEGSSQTVVDAVDSAVYFYSWKHWIIGDHNNQGFDKIKNCKNGTEAIIETQNGVYQYKCVAKIQGHNTGTELTDINYNNIKALYPNTLVCYTCNEHWTNITLVFFEKVVTDELGNEKEEPLPKPYPSQIENCKKGLHVWGDWELAWETTSDNGNRYGWNKRICKICFDEEWKQIEY